MKLRLQSKDRRRKAGTTLVETLLATSIIALLGAAVVGSLNYGMVMLRLARENGRATQIMLEKMESIRLFSWSQITSNGFVPSTFTDVYDWRGPTNQSTVFFGTLSIGNVPFTASYTPFMKMLTVTLNWYSFGRIAHTRTMYTYVSKDGIQNYVY